jgi:uncharacterized protein
MALYKRQLKLQITKKLWKGKVIIVYGARQVGKTTLVKQILKEYGGGRYISCDEIDVRTALTAQSHEVLKSYFGDEKLIVLDEAQQVEDIGLILKIMVDFFPEVQIIATGSSSFDLANKVGEPLVGRSYEFHLHPLMLSEVAQSFREQESDMRTPLDTHMQYGLYPEVLGTSDEKRETLERLVNGNLYKDVLAYRGVKKPMLVVSLLKLLAHQVGNEVSYSELALRLSVDKETVMSYISLLEQAFIIFRLPPLTNNKRREVSRLHKIYFWDVGIRNAVIGAFDSMDARTDTGALFENFFIAEKLKLKNIARDIYSAYFWRTKTKQEVDFVEERSGGTMYTGFECKTTKQLYAVPTEWVLLYPNAPITLVHKDNLFNLLSAAE